MKRFLMRILFSFAILSVVAGCAVIAPGKVAEPAPEPAEPTAAPRDGEFVGAPVETPPAVEPPRPRHNLSGFPLPYRQGYDDGCNSAGGTERKDAQRFARDANYRMGWQDGYSLCGAKK